MSAIKELKVLNVSMRNYLQGRAKQPKNVWKYVNEKLKYKVGTSPLWIDNDIAITDEDKANTLNKFFASVFTWKNLDNVPKVEPSSTSNDVTIADMCTTAES